MKGENRLLLLAIVCALAAAVMTFRAGDSEGDSAGPVVDVVVSTVPLAAGRQLGDDELASLRVVSMPARWAPPDAIADPVDALAATPLVDLPEGVTLSSSLLAAADAPQRWRLRGGERAVSVEVVVSPEGEQLGTGDRVDLFASGFGGNQRTSQVISGAEVLAGSEGEGRAKQRITLRLAAAQVSSVVRADVFAQELRAVKRARG